MKNKNDCCFAGVKELTLSQQADLCCGLDTWHTRPVDEKGVVSLTLSDGPNGVRKQAERCDHLGANGSLPSTCFPTLGALAASWDRELTGEVAAAIGEECRLYGVDILLGPCINIKRHPLGGRNFESLSEDPFLCGQLASAYVIGLQKQGVGAAVKHFACNNQETNRLFMDVEIDQRALHEIYLPGFEACIVQAKPWMIMAAYNRLNGTACAENCWLLTELLRKKWGFEGVVVSDWGGITLRGDGIHAGLDLEMPGSFGNGQKSILRAIASGKLQASELETSAGRMLELIEKCRSSGDRSPAEKEQLFEDHHRLARRAAEESIVLLKNENRVLPLDSSQHIAVIGAYAAEPVFQGGGSSRLCPTTLDSPLECLKKLLGEGSVTYAPGYCADSEEDGFFVLRERFASATNTADTEKIAEAVKAASEADVAVVFVGLPGSYHCESFDRRDLRLPDGQSALIDAVCGANPDTVIVLMCGGPVEMPWLDRCRGVLYCGLAGQAVGSAVAGIIAGDLSPSGKLTESFPKSLTDCPGYLDFPGGKSRVRYREGIFVGYRYYEAKHLFPLFPFGFGLSYTDFEYSGLRIEKNVDDASCLFHIECTIKNTGRMLGRETVQLYIDAPPGNVVRPAKELKGFETVTLMPGQSKTVRFDLSTRSFSYYDSEKEAWSVEDGTYRLLIGASSRDIRFDAELMVENLEPAPVYGWNSIISEIRRTRTGACFLDKHMAAPESGMASFFEQAPLKVSVNMGNLISLEDAETLIELLNHQTGEFKEGAENEF